MLKFLQSAIQRGSKHNDMLLAVLVLAIIALMIIPLPTFIVDGLLAVNLGIAVILLMMSMYVKNVLEFSTFPSLLLFTTLLRLSLNITTTRLILLHADAGEVITTFGKFVISGNLVVGVVVFLIITIVQFMVIAKGAERVAEVGARFTLDAMPGKQMSIDADLRAGVIDVDQAKQRRGIVEQESQLYGALDGAMKFVKGDAIAGLIIAAINILGGILIGVTQRGWPIEKALEVYAVLTIGDGLVSQIPAVLIAMTAGIIVTRVASDDSPALGGDIGKQLLGQPKALLIGGVLLLLFALVPGFPKVQFLSLGLIIGAVGLTIQKVGLLAPKVDDEEMPLPAVAPSGTKPSEMKEESPDDFSVTVPLIVDVPASIENNIDTRTLNRELIRVRKALYHDLGIPFPGIHLRYNESMVEGTYRILLQEIPVAEGRLREGYVLVREHPDNLTVLGIDFENDTQFLPDIPTIWVAETQRNELLDAGVQVLDPPHILTHHLAYVLKRYAADFLGLQETKYLLDQMEPRFGEIVREVQRVLPIHKLTEVLQRLVQEEISIRNLRLVLQALVDWGQKEKDSVLLVEYVRSSLRRYISYKYSGGKNILAAYLLEPSVEEIIRKSIRQTSGGAFLALDPETNKRLLQAVRSAIGDLSQISQKPVLLTAMDVRRYVKKLLDSEYRNLPVLSYQELTEEINIQPLAKISL